MSAAKPQDVDQIAGSLPETELGVSWGDRPTWKVRGKGFVIYRKPGKTAIDPATGEPFEDLIVISTPDLTAKAALVQADGPFFEIEHFNGYPAVLVQESRLGELDRDELVEVITDAWAAKAPKRLVAAYFAQHTPAFEVLPAPARRALAAAGIDTTEAAAATPDADLLRLHGFGPKALRLLREGSGA